MDPRELRPLLRVLVKGDSMWPTLTEGDEIFIDETGLPIVDSIVVFKHPLKSEICIKRVVRIEGERLFVQGDNPDPLSSEDSHNFGTIASASIMGVLTS